MPLSSDKESVYDAQCIVRLQTVRDSDAICHFPFEDRWLTICCPLRVEAFEADPTAYSDANSHRGRPILQFCDDR